MKRTNLEKWICEVEALPELTREGLEALQLKKLNEMLSRLTQQSRFYVNLPSRIDSLQDLQNLPFTTSEMLAAQPGKFLLTSQSEVSRVISGARKNGDCGCKEEKNINPKLAILQKLLDNPE